MKVTVNGAPQELPDGATVGHAVAEHAGAAPSRIAVAVNGDVVPQREWDDVTLSDGDRVEIVAAIQGG